MHSTAELLAGTELYSNETRLAVAFMIVMINRKTHVQQSLSLLRWGLHEGKFRQLTASAGGFWLMVP